MEKQKLEVGQKVRLINMEGKYRGRTATIRRTASKGQYRVRIDGTKVYRNVSPEKFLVVVKFDETVKKEDLSFHHPGPVGVSYEANATVTGKIEPPAVKPGYDANSSERATPTDVGGRTDMNKAWMEFEDESKKPWYTRMWNWLIGK